MSIIIILFVGSGVDIYVFGVGIDYDHKEFEGRAFDGKFIRRNSPIIQGNCQYGTHFASVAVGKSVGVATKANVYRYELFIAYQDSR